MIRLLPEEHKSLAQYVYSLCAIALDESKGYLIEGRLASLVEETGCGSYGGLLLRAKTDTSRALDRRIVDAITTNETSFFRDISPFDLLRHKIVPELIDRRKRTGAAPHPHLERGLFHRPGALQYRDPAQGVARGSRPVRCQAGGLGHLRRCGGARQPGALQPVEISRGLSEAQRTRHFTPIAGGWQIRDEIRAMASFKKLNLMADFGGLGRFDVIFCRNVAIYFNERDKISLFGRIAAALEPEGYLVIGAMESLNGVCPRFESKRHLRSVYYQVKRSV